MKNSVMLEVASVLKLWETAEADELAGPAPPLFKMLILGQDALRKLTPNLMPP